MGGLFAAFVIACYGKFLANALKFFVVFTLSGFEERYRANRVDTLVMMFFIPIFGRLVTYMIYLFERETPDPNMRTVLMEALIGGILLVGLGILLVFLVSRKKKVMSKGVSAGE